MKLNEAVRSLLEQHKKKKTGLDKNTCMIVKSIGTFFFLCMNIHTIT